MRENYLCIKSICRWRADYGSSRLARILSLALPIVAGMVSQNILNLIDTAMVGSFGDAALAAVGLGGFFVFLCQALFLGASTGVQTVAARRKGAGRVEEMAAPLNAALLLIVGLAVPYSMGLFNYIDSLFPLLNNDPSVVGLAVPYIEIRIASLAFIAANFAFRGYWNAVDQSKIYMINLLATHVVNVILNYVLIFGHWGAPEMGVAGAGLATAIATVVGTGAHIFMAIRLARKNGFLKVLPDKKGWNTLTKMSLTAGFNHGLGIGGFTVLFWIIGKIGTAEVAAANVILNISMTVFLPAMGFGLAAATLVGQALGAGNPAEAQRWGWDTVRVGSITLAIISTPLWLAPDLVAGIFIKNPETLAMARLPLQITGISLGVDAAGMILMNALFGAGANRDVLISNMVLQWVLFLPIAYLIGPVLGFGLTAIWIAQVVHRVTYTFVFGAQWRKGKWATIAI